MHRIFDFRWPQLIHVLCLCSLVAFIRPAGHPNSGAPLIHSAIASDAPCFSLGDVDRDGLVTLADLRLVAGHWRIDATYDISGNGSTTIEDLQLIATHQNLTCPWLPHLNYFRAMAGVQPLAENTAWDDGAWLHARYMVINNLYTKDEDPANLWYTAEGATAGQDGLIFAASNINTNDLFILERWLSNPFSAVRLLDPGLFQTGYGSYRARDGGFQAGASLDVVRGLGSVPDDTSYPLVWPKEAETVPLTAFEGFGSPNPLTSCPGYSSPTGLPIILFLGFKNLVPNITASSFKQGTIELAHCTFHKENYVNSNPDLQTQGRAILEQRNAIILIPRDPLEAGTSYTASITTNGQTKNWSFTTAAALP